MGRVSHDSVLVLGDLGAQEDPGLVLDVEDPQLAGHVSGGVDLPSVHVDLPLEETAERSLGSLEVPVVVPVPPRLEPNQKPQKVANPCHLRARRACGTPRLHTSALVAANTLA